MAVEPGDLLKVVMEALDPLGNKVSNKFTFLTEFEGSLPHAAVSLAVHDWMETAFETVKAGIQHDSELGTAIIDVIKWVGSRWEVEKHIDETDPDVTFSCFAEPLPLQVAACVLYNTYRPRVRRPLYLWGGCEWAAQDGKWIPSQVVRLADFAAATMSDVVCGFGHRLVPAVMQASGALVTAISGAVVTDIPSAMTRRRPEG